MDSTLYAMRFIVRREIGYLDSLGEDRGEPPHIESEDDTHVIYSLSSSLY